MAEHGRRVTTVGSTAFSKYTADEKLRERERALFGFRAPPPVSIAIAVNDCTCPTGYGMVVFGEGGREVRRVPHLSRCPAGETARRIARYGSTRETPDRRSTDA